MLASKETAWLIHIMKRTHLVFAIITLFIAFFTLKTSDAQYTGFPSLNETDGKFLSIAGDDVAGGMNDQTVYLWIRIPGDQTSFEIGIFDGDQGGYWDITWGDNPDTSNWRFFYDPDKDGNGNGRVSEGNGGSWTNLDMSDNAWTTRFYPTSEKARMADGNFLYLLIVSWNRADDSDDLNGFKVRSTGQVSYVLGKTFAVIGAPINVQGDRDGPGADTDLPFSYDGDWRFSFWVPAGRTKINLEEGDADHGPNGNPPDDNADNPALSVAPDIRYEILSPGGVTIFPNVQPSGNMEGLNDLVVHEHDYGSILPPGLYTWHWYGQDSHNQTIIKATYELFTPGIDIFPDNAQNAEPGAIVEYKHTVSNKDNKTRTINLLPSSSMGWQITLYAADGVTLLGDTDGDGKKDVGLVAGFASRDIVAKIQVPHNAVAHTEDVTTIKASARIEELQTEVFDWVRDTTTVIQANPPAINLVKGVDKTAEKPGGTLTYSIEVGNNGGATAFSIVVIDVIPEHTTYITGSAAGNNATIKYRHSGADFDFSQAEPVTAIMWILNELPVAQRANLSMKVTID